MLGTWMKDIKIKVSTQVKFHSLLEIPCAKHPLNVSYFLTLPLTCKPIFLICGSHFFVPISCFNGKPIFFVFSLSEIDGSNTMINLSLGLYTIRLT